MISRLSVAKNIVEIFATSYEAGSSKERNHGLLARRDSLDFDNRARQRRVVVTFQGV
jgi:hypothetical protein